MTAILAVQTDHAPPSLSTRRYHVRCGGYEGSTFAVEGFIVDVPDTFLGLGTRDRIFAAAAERSPGKDVLEFEPVRNAA